MALKLSKNEQKPIDTKGGAMLKPYFYAFCLNIKDNAFFCN